MTEQPSAAPTQEEMAQGADVATAAATAAAAEQTPQEARKAAKKAVRDSAPASFELSDDDCEKIANLVVDQMESRGAFEAPPERLQPAPVSSPEQPAALPVAEQPQPAPAHKSFAEKFRGK